MPKPVVNGESVADAIGGVSSVGAVPIGGCIPWMAPAVGAPEPPPPTGYEYADGGAVSTVGSPLFGLAKPPLMKTVASPGVTQRMVRGGNTTVPYGGATPLVVGGADSHTHTGTTDVQGSHSHTATAHSHSVASDGNHDHGGFTGYATTEVVPSGAYFQSTGAPGSHRHPVTTGGAHSHGGATGNASPTTDAQGNHSHALNVNAGANLPSYAELAWIIRVL